MKADLHLHSCLSPCALLTMGPKTIVARAKERGLDIVALTDHNSALNTPALEKLCADAGLGFLAGIEVTTREEAHCLCLFSESKSALDFGELLFSRQTRIPNKPERMGDQIIVDENEDVLGEVEFWLTAATDIDWEELGELTHGHGGLWIPAHIDRAHGGVITQLGFLPPAAYNALEVVDAAWPGDRLGLRLIRGSDAHAPEHIGRRFWELEEAPGTAFAKVKAALL